MQTFAPLPDFGDCARVLDRARLGKQRVEVAQILHALTTPAYGWQHHPAVQMWRGHAGALVRYGLAVCNEWVRRGYADTVAGKLREIAATHNLDDDALPGWWGDDRLHSSHRACLLAKDAAHYGQFGWTETPAVRNAKGSLPYWWPTKQLAAG